MVMDTSTDSLAVGVGHTDGRLLSSVVQRVPRGHSRLLQPSLSFALESAGMTPSDIECIGIGIGPGSYTGVRMAVATGKAMAHALGVPIVAIPTLDAVALAVGLGRGGILKPGTAEFDGVETAVLPLFYARRQRAFGARYRVCEGQLTHRETAQVLQLHEWLGSLVEGKTNPSVVVHDVPKRDAGVLHEFGSVEYISLQDIAPLLPQAFLRLCTSGRYETYRGAALHDVAPDYVLAVEAETKLQAQTQGGTDG